MTHVSKTPELDKQLAFVHDGTTQTLSEFYDWLESRGWCLMRWEETREERECPGQGCIEGRIREPNPDPMAGWSTSVPEYIERICPRCDGQGYLIKVSGEDWVGYAGGPEQLFADFLGIDRDKIEAERRMLLKELQEAHHDK